MLILALAIGIGAVPALAYLLLGSGAPELVHRTPENGFLAVTAFLFLSLWTLTAVKVRRWHRIVSSAERWFGNVGHLFVDGDADIDRVRVALDAIAVQARGPGGRPFTHRLATLRRLIEFHASTASPPARPERIARAIAGHDGSLIESPDLRALEHTLVSALLFIGIIGTFFGLIEFLGSKNFGDFVQNSRGTDLFKHLPEVTHGLGTAFWTSLFAYVFYLVGRFVVDQCEEEYERSARAFVDTVQGGLACLFPITGRATVDLSDRSAELLAGTARQMEDTTEAVRTLVEETRSAAGALANAAGALIAAVTHAAETSEMIFKIIKAGQEDWREAAAEWKAATKAFVDASGPLTDGIRSLLHQVHILPSEFRTQAEAMITDLKSVTERNGETLTAHAEALGTRLKASATLFSDSLDAFSRQLEERIGAHEAILRAVTKTDSELYQQRQDMMAKLEQFHAASERIRTATFDAVNGIAAKEGERTEELRHAVLAMTASIDSLRDRMETLRHLMIGTGKPEDLLSTLKALREASSQLSLRADLRVGEPL